MTISVQIRFSDYDPLNHVNNVAFFEIMETARVEFIRQRRIPTLRGHMVVRHASCDYEAEVPGGVRAVQVRVSVEKVGVSSFTVLHELHVEDTLVGRGRVVMVALGEDRRPRQLSEQERTALLAPPG